MNSGIRVCFNYWEMRPSQMRTRLDRLVQEGVQRLTSFVPWQAFETDIAHALLRFLQAAQDRKLHVELIITPEAGLPYKLGGVPPDIMRNKKNLAHTEKGEKFSVFLPPQAYLLPSLCSEEFKKRFQAFLTRLQVFLLDFSRTPTRSLTGITLKIGGSFWKHYRHPSMTGFLGYENASYEASAHFLNEFRKLKDEHFSQKEFLFPHASEVNRWKSQAYDSVNIPWCFQKMEDDFRLLVSNVLSKKGLDLKKEQIEFLAPEADPALTYSQFLRSRLGGFLEMSRLSQTVAIHAVRMQTLHSDNVPPWYYWNSLGGFSSLSDAEKQFLILQSLILGMARGGGVVLEESEWLALSSSFRTRIEHLAQLIRSERFEIPVHITYLLPQLGSSGGVRGEMFRTIFGASLCFSNLQAGAKHVPKETKIVIIDADSILQKSHIYPVREWLKAGYTVVLPKTHLITEAGRKEMAFLTHDMKILKTEAEPLPYTCYEGGGALLVIYEVPEWTRSQAESAPAWEHFAKVLAYLTDFITPVQIHDHRLSHIWLRSGHSPDRGLLLVMNPSERSLSTDVSFKNRVQAGDYRVVFGTAAETPTFSGEWLDRFQLDVPAYGVLPVALKISEKELGISVERVSGIVEREEIHGSPARLD